MSKQVKEAKKATKTSSKKRKTVAIDVFKTWCKGCGICVSFCPKEVLALDEDGQAYAKNLDACIACMQCELRCPDFAITVITEDRLKAGKGGLS